MTRVVIHNHLPTRDASEGVKGMMERQAAMIAQAKAGEDRMTALLNRVTAARKALKKRGDTPHNGYAAQSDHLVKRARASFGQVIYWINNGMLYKFDELMADTKEPERVANEAVASIERQVAERQGRDAGYSPVEHYKSLAAQSRAAGNEKQALHLEQMAKEAAAEAKQKSKEERATRKIPARDASKEDRLEAALAEAERIVAQKRKAGQLTSLTAELQRILGSRDGRDNDGLAERIAGAKALYERPGTPGEKAAAEAALRRMGIDPSTLGARSATRPQSQYSSVRVRYEVILQYTLGNRTLQTPAIVTEAPDEATAERKAREQVNWFWRSKYGGKPPDFRSYSTRRV
jgi:hypothetical protein